MMYSKNTLMEVRRLNNKKDVTFVTSFLLNTNIIEGVNRRFRKITKTKSTFLSYESVLKLLSKTKYNEKVDREI